MSKVDKKLSAIMFTDIVGYTQQMSEDEDKAFALIKKKRDLLLPLIEKHEGKLIKEIGDGTLTRYFKADDAIECASRFQSKTDDDLNVRIGIHTGEVIIDNEDVFGDVVNVASRLESIAVPGSVLVSNETVDKLEMSKNFELVSLGMQSLKGVGRLIEVYAINEASLVVPKSSDFKDSKVDIHDSDEVPAIAIIPFENKGADEDVFYAYGISADLITDCSSAGLIRVASLKDVEKLDFDNMDTSEISKKLLVRYIAQGTLWKMGEMFQLSIELYDAKDKKVIWSDRWQEKWDNLPTIKNKLSDGLLKALNTKHEIDEKVQTHDSLAYEYYLKAKYKYEKRENIEHLVIVRNLLKKALELDPVMSTANIGLGISYFQIGEYEKAMKYYEIALEQAKRNNDIKEIANCMGNIANIYSEKNEYEESFSLYNQALLIRKQIGDKKGYANCLYNIGSNYSSQGLYKEALINYENALKIRKKIDDKIGIGHCLNSIGNLYLYKGDTESALKSFKKSLEAQEQINDFYMMSYSLACIAYVYQQNEDFKLAIDYYEKALSIQMNLGDKRGASYTYLNMGNVFSDKIDFDESISFYKKSLKLGSELNDQQLIANNTLNIANTYLIKGDLNNADEFLKDCLKIYKKINDLRGEAYTTNSISILHYSKNEHKESLDYIIQSISIQNEIDLREDLYFNSQLIMCFNNEMLGISVDKNALSKILKNLKKIDYDTNILLYDITKENSYLIKAYHEIQEIISKADNELGNKFSSYPIPKRILEEYKKL